MDMLTKQKEPVDMPVFEMRRYKSQSDNQKRALDGAGKGRTTAPHRQRRPTGRNRVASRSFRKEMGRNHPGAISEASYRSGWKTRQTGIL